jgi:hypothetical protein
MLLKKTKINRSKFFPLNSSKPVSRDPKHHRELTKAAGWKSARLYVPLHHSRTTEPVPLNKSVRPPENPFSTVSATFCRTHSQQKSRADHRQVGCRPADWSVILFLHCSGHDPIGTDQMAIGIPRRQFISAFGGAANIASSERFLSVRVPAAAAIDDLQRLIFVSVLCTPRAGLAAAIFPQAPNRPQESCCWSRVTAKCFRGRRTRSRIYPWEVP